MDCSRPTVTMFFIGEKTHAAINSELIRKLDFVDNALYEVEVAKAENESKKLIVVGLILQHAKLPILDLYNTFFNKFCDENKFEELDLNTDSLHPFLAEEKLEGCFRPKKRAE